MLKESDNFHNQKKHFYVILFQPLSTPSCFGNCLSRFCWLSITLISAAFHFLNDRGSFVFCSVLFFPLKPWQENHHAVEFLGAHFAMFSHWIFGAPLVKAQLAYPGKIAANMIRGGPINSNSERCTPLALWSLSRYSVCCAENKAQSSFNEKREIQRHSPALQ